MNKNDWVEFHVKGVSMAGTIIKVEERTLVVKTTAGLYDVWIGDVIAVNYKPVEREAIR